MLADKLISRAQRCVELNTMLEAAPGDPAAGDWIAEIARKALSRGEVRHVAIVRQVLHLRRRIAAAEAMTVKDETDHIASLEARREAEPKRAARWDSKIRRARARKGESEMKIAVEQGKIPILRQRLEDFMASDELITKEDLIDG